MGVKRVSARRLAPSTAAESERSGDRDIMSPYRAPPAAPRKGDDGDHRDTPNSSGAPFNARRGEQVITRIANVST